MRCPQRMNQGDARNPLRQRTLQRDLVLECGDTSPLLEARMCLRTPNLALAFAPSWVFDTINRNETKLPLGRRVSLNCIRTVRTGAISIAANGGF